MKNYVGDYRDKLETYQAFAERFKELLRELLKTSDIKIHFIESRAKTPESFAEKLSRPGKQYKDPFTELPDIVGVRIVLYYLDDIPKVGALLANEFSIIEEERGHLPESYAADQFGYLSMHYVLTLKDNRSALPEWNRFKEIKAEIQVRTVLQHSWAAVSHVLQYKREGNVPLALRRRLHRLCGLFELADEEFVTVRREASELTKVVSEALKNDPDSVDLDSESLKQLLSSWSDFPAIGEKLKALGWTIDLNSSDDEENIGFIIENSHRIGIKQIADFKRVLRYDPIPFLSSAYPPMKDIAWGETKLGILRLMLIGSQPDYFNEELLRSYGFQGDIAKKVVKAAKATKTRIDNKQRKP